MSICLNHRLAAGLAIDHLLELGHRKIAILKGQAFSSDTQIRWKSIADAAKKRGLALDLKLVEQLDGLGPGNELGYAATRRLLKAGRQFSALFAFNDSAAIGRDEGVGPRPGSECLEMSPWLGSTMCKEQHFRTPD